jgi:flagellar basal body-associated protein FliL
MSGLDKYPIYYYINLNHFSTNLENTQKDNFLNAPKSLQVEVMKKNAQEELKGHTPIHKLYIGDDINGTKKAIITTKIIPY